MKTRLTTRIAAGLFFLAPLFASATPVLSIVPSTTTAGFNQLVTFAVNVSGLNSVVPNQIVSAFDLDILFDPALLTQSGVATFQATSLFGGAANAFFDTIGTTAGDAAGSAYSLASDADLNALQGDSFTLFTVSLTTGTASGPAFLNFGPDVNFQRLLVGLDGLSLSSTYAGACIAIGNSSCTAVVPEPASLALVAFGIVAAGAARRRSGRLVRTR